MGNGPDPADSSSNITKDLLAGGGVLVAAPLNKIGRFVGQLQVGRRAGKQRYRQGRMAMGGQAIRDAANPGIHTKHLRQHDINTLN